MVLVLLTLVGVALVPVLGGRFRRLAGLRVRHAWVIGAALGAQIVLLAALRSAPAWQTDTIHVATYLVAGGFVWHNRQLRGLPIAALGGLCNFAAIAANGGVMPASPAALRAAGKVLDLTEFTNSGPMAHPRLLFLGDVIPFPYPHALANVFSIGDILLVLGILVVIHQTCGSSLRRSPARRAAAATAAVIDSTVAPIVDMAPVDVRSVDALTFPDAAAPDEPVPHRSASDERTRRPSRRWAPPLPLPSPPTAMVDEALVATVHVYPIDLLPLSAPADGRPLVDA